MSDDVKRLVDTLAATPESAALVMDALRSKPWRDVVERIDAACSANKGQ